MTSFLFLVLLVSSCHPSDQNTATRGPSTDTVVIRQMQFIPAVLSVSAGDTVIWVNKGMVDHTVTSQDASWSSDTVRVGSTWKKVITDSINYFCSIHPTMKGRVLVK